MYTDGQTVNVPAVINERKVYIVLKCATYTQQIVIVLLAVILHKHNIAQGSKTGAIIKDLCVIPKLGHWG